MPKQVSNKCILYIYIISWYFIICTWNCYRLESKANGNKKGAIAQKSVATRRCHISRVPDPQITSEVQLGWRSLAVLLLRGHLKRCRLLGSTQRQEQNTIFILWHATGMIFYVHPTYNTPQQSTYEISTVAPSGHREHSGDSMWSLCPAALAKELFSFDLEGPLPPFALRSQHMWITKIFLCCN